MDQDKKPLHSTDPEKELKENEAQKPLPYPDAVPDLDGDGMIGHTGGNYGDTTYTGGSLIEPQPGIVEEAPEQTEEDSEKE